MVQRFSLRQLEYLVAVADCGSIAEAAAQGHVTSPTISTALSQLERALGLTLFVRRHAQGLSVTPAGAEVVAQARRVLAEAGRMGDVAQAITGRVGGPLAVGCLLTFAQMLLPRLRRDFVTRYPDVIFRQFERDQTDIIRGIRTATLDVALTYDLGIPDDLSFQPLLRLPPYAVFGEGHPLAARSEVAVAELAAHPMVLLDLPLSADYFMSLFSEAGLRPNIAERTRDLAVMQGLVAYGIGYSIANMRPFPDRAPDGTALRLVPLTGDLRPMHLGVLMADGAGASLTVKAFVAACRALVEALPPAPSVRAD
jgi:DNA-binding transcriptional LysR family regulator